MKPAVQSLQMSHDGLKEAIGAYLEVAPDEIENITVEDDTGITTVIFVDSE